MNQTASERMMLLMTIPFIVTLITIPLFSKDMNYEDPRNTTFYLFSFLLSLFLKKKKGTTALTATGYVGYKHCDVFWPLNPIHYGICKKVIISR